MGGGLGLAFGGVRLGSGPSAEGGEDGVEVLQGKVEGKEGNGDAKNRVDEVDASKAHNNGAEEDSEPGQTIFEHMEIDGLLIKRMAVTGDAGGEEIEGNTKNSEDNHAVGVDLRRGEDALDRFVDENGRADKEDCRGKTGAEEGITLVAMMVALVEVLKQAGKASAQGVAETMDRVGHNGDGAGKEAADKFKGGESEAQEEGKENTLGRMRGRMRSERLGTIGVPGMIM